MMLDVITAGKAPEMPAELLGSAAFSELITEATNYYDAVILDTAPLLPVADTLKVLPQVEGVLVCVRVGRTRAEELRATRDALEHLPSRPVGLVVTGVRRADEAEYGYYPPSRS
jgi:Mrp family chromosome partitioning ATPase